MNSRFIAALVLGLGAVGPVSAEEKVTYSKDIAPILFRNCASCHRPGEVAPFSLLTYKDAAKRANQLVEVTAKRLMPPWKAEPNFGEFRDCRWLTDAELAQLTAWNKAGAPEGDPKDLPPVPTFPEGWPLGKPDLVVKMAKPFDVPAEGRDQIRILPLAIDLPEEKVVRAVDFRPGNRKIVHHALVIVDNIGLMRNRAPAGKGADAPKQPDRRAGLQNLFQSRNGVEPIALLGAWVPGATPQFYPDGYGMKLNKDSKVVLQMHYHSIGKAETDQSEVAFYFAPKPDEVKSLHGMILAGFPLVIPAGEKRVQGEHGRDLTGRCDDPHDFAAHAPGRPGDEGQRDAPRWQAEAARLDQAVGLELAGEVYVQGAGAVAEGDAHRPGSVLRQLSRQPREPQRPAQGGPLGRADVGRNVSVLLFDRDRDGCGLRHAPPVHHPAADQFAGVWTEDDAEEG